MREFSGFSLGRFHLSLAVYLAVGAFLLVADRNATAFGLLPYALALACLLGYVYLHHSATRGRAALPTRIHRRPRNG